MNESTDIFPWNGGFATGIPQIDEQHQRLVHLVNMLASSIASKADVPALNEVIIELEDYAVYHFKTEENLWQQYLAGDDLETTHKKVHDSFIADVNRLKNEKNAKLQYEVIEDIFSFLTNWLVFHILDTDKRMANIVLAMQSGMSLDLAKHYVNIQSSDALKALIENTLSMYHQLSKQTLQLMKEVNERKLMEEQLLQLSFYDLLTKLPNRRLLDDRLSQAMATSKRSARYGALMFLDLDNFKPLNDKHGHAVGDLLLIEAADRLKNCIREIDTVARFGGDEFVVLLSELDVGRVKSLSQAGIVAEKIRTSLSVPYLLTKKHEGEADTAVEHHCTASIGVTLFINHKASQDDIIKWSDMAMYQAKEDGRNLIRFYDSKV